MEQETNNSLNVDFLTFSTNPYITLEKKIKFYKLLNKDDSNIRFDNMTKFGLLLHNVQNGIDVETSIFEYAVLYILNNHYDNNLFYSVYDNKINSIYYIITSNPKIIQRINDNQINPKNIAFLPNPNLCPERWEKIIEKQKKIEERKQEQPTTDAYLCPHCHNRKSIVRIVQTRSSDEALTTFVTCCVCGTTIKI